jgi:hypothetical protein
VKHHLSPHRTRRQWDALVRELAVPAPFERSEFRARIERHTHCGLELIPAVMRPAAPSGTWLRTDRADYFYYEEQTSPFHQAHIVLSLAAHVLLGDAAAPSVDLRLVPGGGPELVRLMLGGIAASPVTHLEAETFAFLALERARPVCYPPFLARRALRQLRPLHSALREARSGDHGRGGLRTLVRCEFPAAPATHRDPRRRACAQALPRSAGGSGRDTGRPGGRARRRRACGNGGGVRPLLRHLRPARRSPGTERRRSRGSDTRGRSGPAQRDRLPGEGLPGVRPVAARRRPVTRRGSAESPGQRGPASPRRPCTVPLRVLPPS